MRLRLTGRKGVKAFLKTELSLLEEAAGGPEHRDG